MSSFPSPLPSSLITSLSTLSLSSTSSSPHPPNTLTLTHPQSPPTTTIHSLLFPALSFSTTLYFKRPYNVQVIVGGDESEESLVGRFRREVFRGNVIQECKRRRFFETNQEMRKRKLRDAARRRSRRRQQPVAKKEDTQRKKTVDDPPDNWDLIDIEVPYCK